MSSRSTQNKSAATPPCFKSTNTTRTTSHVRQPNGLSNPILTIASSTLATRAIEASQIPEKAQISTSFESVDQLLDGGLGRGRITQVCGRDQSGKTSFCLHIALQALNNGQSITWLDTTTSTFHLHKRLTLNSLSTDISSRLHIVPLLDFSHAIEVLNALRNDHANTRVFKISGAHSSDIIVFDCPASFLSPLQGFRAHDGWTGVVATNTFSLAIRNLAQQTHAAILVTNRIVVLSEIERPALGKFWTSLIDVNITLTTPRQYQRMLRESIDVYDDNDEQNSLTEIDVRIKSKLSAGGKCRLYICKDGSIVAHMKENGNGHEVR